MGLKLTLLPFDGDNFSQTVLPFEQDPQLFERIEQIEEMEGRDVPENFRSGLGQDGWRVTIETAYHEPLKYVKAGSIAPLYLECAPHLTDKNKAALAYCVALRPDTNVALYWC